MRLGLPESVRGIPIRHVVAYDVSNVANEVSLLIESDVSSIIMLFRYIITILKGTIYHLTSVPCWILKVEY